LLALLSAPLHASVPDWLRTLAAQPLPPYPDNPDVVQLLDEQSTTVSKDGEIITFYRRAFRIVRRGNFDPGALALHFDSETRLTFLKGYTITSTGLEFEVKEKDAVETSAAGASVLFSDQRYKILTLRAAEPGAVVGYEYQQRRRPGGFDDGWYFQQRVPVRHARFLLRLPPGWAYRAFWINHPELAAQPLGENAWAWEMTDIPAVADEAAMPTWRAVAGRMLLKYVSPLSEFKARQHASWDDVGRWYYQVASSQRTSSPAMDAKADQLTAGASDPLQKIRALAGFVQNDIRYVAIVIGVGGYVPHPATDVFTNRFGDCKDKVTLLAAMLQHAGFDSYYVLTDSDRGLVQPDVPIFMFDHVIIAVRLPEGTPLEQLPAATTVPGIGPLLFFDPTSRLAPLGSLPPGVQDNYGLLVTPRGGRLLRFPLAPAKRNSLRRTAHFTLAEDGTLSGQVNEVLSGAVAYDQRAHFADAPADRHSHAVESWLRHYLANFSLRSSEVANVEKINEDLIFKYDLVAPRYAQAAGDLLLLRPRVVGQKSSDFLEERKPRAYPVQYPAARVDTDLFEIQLPRGYVVDELPPPVNVDSGFAAYRSTTSVNSGVVQYQRTFTVNDVFFPLSRIAELKEFLRQVSADEQNPVVLKKAPKP